MKLNRRIITIWILISLFIPSCGGGSLFGPTPTLVPITNLEDAYRTTHRYALEKLPGEGARAIDVTSIYKVADTKPTWESAVFVFESESEYLVVTATQSGEIGQINLDSNALSQFTESFRADLFDLIVNHYDEEILALAWNRHGALIHESCGPITTIRYHLIGDYGSNSPFPSGTWDITYNGIVTVVIGEVQSIAGSYNDLISVEGGCP